MSQLRNMQFAVTVPRNSCDYLDISIYAKLLLLQTCLRNNEKACMSQKKYFKRDLSAVTKQKITTAENEAKDDWRYRNNTTVMQAKHVHYYVCNP